MKSFFRVSFLHHYPLLAVLLVFFVIESTASVVFYTQMTEFTPFSYAVLALLADMMIPTLLAAMAFFLKSRICAVCSVLSMVVVLFIKIANDIIFYKMYSIICYGTSRVLLVHADHHSMTILFGRFYYLWITAVFLLLLYMVLCAAFLSMRRIRNGTHPAALNRIRVILLLLLLVSIAANAKYRM